MAREGGTERESERRRIEVEVELDEEGVPQRIAWSASDAGDEPRACEALLLALWDSARRQALRLDLWTPRMPVQEMNALYHHTLRSLADTYRRATGDARIAEGLAAFADEFARQTGLVERED